MNDKIKLDEIENFMISSTFSVGSYCLDKKEIYDTFTLQRKKESEKVDRMILKGKIKSHQIEISFTLNRGGEMDYEFKSLEYDKEYLLKDLDFKVTNAGEQRG